VGLDILVSWARGGDKRVFAVGEDNGSVVVAVVVGGGEVKFLSKEREGDILESLTSTGGYLLSPSDGRELRSVEEKLARGGLPPLDNPNRRLGGNNRGLVWGVARRLETVYPPFAVLWNERTARRQAVEVVLRNACADMVLAWAEGAVQLSDLPGGGSNTIPRYPRLYELPKNHLSLAGGGKKVFLWVVRPIVDYDTLIFPTKPMGTTPRREDAMTNEIVGWTDGETEEIFSDETAAIDSGFSYLRENTDVMVESSKTVPFAVLRLLANNSRYTDVPWNSISIPFTPVAMLATCIASGMKEIPAPTPYGGSTGGIPPKKFSQTLSACCSKLAAI